MGNYENLNLWETHASNFSEFQKKAETKYPLILMKSTTGTKNLLGLNLTDADLPQPSAERWIMINHHFGICYEVDVKRQNGFRDLAYCAGVVSCINTAPETKPWEKEFYLGGPGKAGRGCQWRGYNKFKVADPWYPGNIWAFFGWKAVSELKTMYADDAEIREQIKWNTKIADQTGTQETADNVEYMTTCREEVYGKKYHLGVDSECQPRDWEETKVVS